MKGSAVFVVVVNVAYAFIAVVVATLGAVILSDVGRLEELVCFDDLPLRRASVSVLCVGSAMVVVSCLGFAGAVRDSRGCISVFALLTVASAAVEVIFGLVLAFGVRDAVDSALRQRWSQPLNEDAVRCFQDTYNCCGYDADETLAYGCALPPASPYCADEAVSRVERYSVPVGWVLLVMGMLHAAAIAMACAAACSSKEAPATGAARPVQLRNTSSHSSRAHAQGELEDLSYRGSGVEY